MKSNAILVTALVFVCIFLLFEVTSARGGGGSRGGGGFRASRGGGFRSSIGSSRSRTSFFRSTSSRVRTGSRFVYNRAGYSYGAYNGVRFGTAIRSRDYWPVRRLYYGYPFIFPFYYHSYRWPSASNSPPPVETLLNATSPAKDAAIPETVTISDNFIKTTFNDSGLLYNCTYLNTTISCLNPSELVNPATLDAWDGGCCEDSTGNAVCCVIEISNDDENSAPGRSNIHVYLTMMIILATSLLLIVRVCR